MVSPGQAIKAYIDEVLQSSPTLGEIAMHFNICEATVIRLLKREYGETPNSYIKTQRLTLAESLLRNTDYSVSKIAELLNYCSHSYFSEEFMKKYGLYPTQYRKSLTGDKK